MRRGNGVAMNDLALDTLFDRADVSLGIAEVCPRRRRVRKDLANGHHAAGFEVNDIEQSREDLIRQELSLETRIDAGPLAWRPDRYRLCR